METGFLRDPAMNFTAANSPEVYDLVASFRSASSPDERYPVFSRTPKSKLILTALSGAASYTLGLLAWDSKNRAKASKYYQEAIQTYETEPVFTALRASSQLAKWANGTYTETRDNLGILLRQDALLAAETGNTGSRKDVAQVPTMRTDKHGKAEMMDKHEFASSECDYCRKRSVKLLVCSRCKSASCKSCPSVFYCIGLNGGTDADCDATCQKAHWSGESAFSVERISSCLAFGQITKKSANLLQRQKERRRSSSSRADDGQCS